MTVRQHPRRAGRRRVVPGASSVEVVDPESESPEVVAAALALALAWLPAESEEGPGRAAEQRGPHGDVPAAPDLAPANGPFAQVVSGQRGVAGPGLQPFDQASDAIGREHDVVVEEHEPG